MSLARHTLAKSWELARAALADSRINRGAVAVYLAILDQLDPATREAHVGMTALSAAAGISLRHAKASVALLVDLGYVQRERGDGAEVSAYRVPSAAPPESSTATGEQFRTGEEDCTGDLPITGDLQITPQSFLLPRETETDAINAAGLARLGVQP
ncbi:hypothetical protein [Stenotrophomonas sp.]|uniref:hypothetical protein n=1 Tax=Stenotrophomonas sp. TaxID=69392 RepID=UPI0019B5850C|nr:hypothetical protein [Stenotrophomonas sp.]MBD3827302.1 hypothetical protein [Stenotrophomonas sp.]